VANVARAAALLQAHEADLAAFLTEDPKGRRLPGYLASLAEHLAGEQKQILQELGSLAGHVEHINEIVATQQSYATVTGFLETASPVKLVEDSLRLNAAAMVRHQIQIVREYAEVPPILVDRHKVLQILINLIRNAKYALDERGRPEKQMTFRVALAGQQTVHISVIDNGIGIPAGNLTRIFGHGFTTRKDGHGFGLHNSALAAKELGGSLTVHSDGPGRGATFTLELPCAPADRAA
jgi:signal transduction histidine kinase